MIEIVKDWTFIIMMVCFSTILLAATIAGIYGLVKSIKEWN